MFKKFNGKNKTSQTLFLLNLPRLLLVTKSTFKKKKFTSLSVNYYFEISPVLLVLKLKLTAFDYFFNWSNADTVLSTIFKETRKIKPILSTKHKVGSE